MMVTVCGLLVVGELCAWWRLVSLAADTVGRDPLPGAGVHAQPEPHAARPLPNQEKVSQCEGQPPNRAYTITISLES